MALVLTINEKLRDEVLAHLIDLHRLANGEVRKILALLNAADSDIFARLVAALHSGQITEFSLARLTSLLSGVWELNDATYRQMATRSANEMHDLTIYELDHQESLFKELLPDALSGRIATLDAQTVYAAAMARPFRGALLADWFERLAANRQRRVEDALRVGFVSGKTVDEMVREVRGTRAQNYADGILQIDRRDAEAVVRTATSHTAQFARQSFYRANEDLITEEQWVSTLDNRTTEMCQIRDGLIYTSPEHRPVGHRVPWLEGPGALHWNCRSTSVPVIDSAKALGIELPPLERASMDGTAAPGTTFRDWIERQSASRQDEILGPTRGALLRRGNLEFESFFNDKGIYLTLDQLREKDAAAFRRAGVQ